MSDVSIWRKLGMLPQQDLVLAAINAVKVPVSIRLGGEEGERGGKQQMVTLLDSLTCSRQSHISHYFTVLTGYN